MRNVIKCTTYSSGPIRTWDRERRSVGTNRNSEVGENKPLHGHCALKRKISSHFRVNVEKYCKEEASE
jgi:hypothetical protein